MHRFARLYIGISCVALALPMLCGWERANLRELLPPEIPEPFCAHPMVSVPVSLPELPAYAILEKASASLTRLQSVRLDMDVWLQDRGMHIRTKFTSTVQNVDDYKTDGRTSVSMTMPRGASSSEWVQTFEINGIPFTWDREKREWKQKELAISGKGSKSVLAYGVLRSLFSVNESAVDRASIRLLGVEQRSGRDCYVISYKIDPRVFARKGVVGDVTVKLWIDSQRFLPYILRAEGEIADMYMLQIVTYSGFNAQPALELPAFILEEVRRQRQELRNKIEGMVKAVADIRGWQPLGGVDAVFCDRVAMRNYLEQEFEKNAAGQDLAMVELVYKWLGLMPQEASYKDATINGQISSIAALFDPAQKKILIGSWLHPALADPVLAHEICHAYQDKAFDLRAYLDEPAVRTDLDRSFARHALIEGDATAVMLEYLLKDENKNFKNFGDIFSFIEEKILRNEQEAAKNIVYSLYGYGANYIQYYLRENTWPQIDALYKNPPESMSEILHPYTAGFSRARADDRQAGYPAADDLPAGGWTQAWTNHIGEFLLQMSLRDYLDKDACREATRGWQKDTLSVYRHPRQGRLIVLSIRWEKPENAQGFLGAYKTYLEKRFSRAAMQDQGFYTLAAGDVRGRFALFGKDENTKIIWGDQLNSEEFNVLIRQICKL